jgi:hypothetical protein
MMVPAPVLMAQYAGTLDFFETSRLDARSTQPFPIAPAPPPREVAIAADASLALTARLRLTNRRWDWAFSYTPTFAITDVELGPYSQPVALNAGSASVGWHDRIVRIVVSELASYGVETLGYVYGTPIAGQSLAAGQTQTGQTQTGQTGTGTGTGGTTGTSTSVGQNGASTNTQSLQTFPYGSSATNATVTVRSSRTVTVTVAGGYVLSGNLANSAQVDSVYPEQYGPLASATVSFAASRADTLVTTASAQDTTTPLGLCVVPTTGTFCRQETPLLTALETVRRRLSTTATIAASLGVSASVYQVTTGRDLGVLPVAGVNYSNTFASLSTVRLAADLAPTVNVFTGTPSTRLQLSAAVVERLSSLVTVSVTASGLQTVPVPRPDPSPLTLLGGGIDMRVRITRFVTGSFGIQGFWQTSPNSGAVPAVTTSGSTTTSSEMGYVALTARLPTLRL